MHVCVCVCVRLCVFKCAQVQVCVLVQVRVFNCVPLSACCALVGTYMWTHQLDPFFSHSRYLGNCSDSMVLLRVASLLDTTILWAVR
jgi:hypothetical protein